MIRDYKRNIAWHTIAFCGYFYIKMAIILNYLIKGTGRRGRYHRKARQTLYDKVRNTGMEKQKSFYSILYWLDKLTGSNNVPTLDNALTAVFRKLAALSNWLNNSTSKYDFPRRVSKHTIKTVLRKLKSVDFEFTTLLDDSQASEQTNNSHFNYVK